MDHTNFDSRFKCSNAPAAGHDWLFRGEKREPAMCTHRSPVQSQWLIWTAGKARPRIALAQMNRMGLGDGAIVHLPLWQSHPWRVVRNVLLATLDSGSPFSRLAGLPQVLI